MRTIIYNGKIICGDTVIPRGYINIEDGIITEIGSGGPTKKTAIRPVQDGAHWIDAEGNYVSAGFIDLHVHGVGICDLYKDTANAIKNMTKILASQGVTSFLPTLITAPIDKIINALSVMKDMDILGINLEGPFINPQKKGAHPIEDIRKPDVKELNQIIEASGGRLRIITIAPELPGALELLGILKENSIIPAIGHTMASYEDTMTAIDKGFIHISHTFNAMTPFHHRAPGAIGAILMRKEVTTEIIADGIHVHPAVVKFLCQLKERDKIILVTDALIGIMRKDDKAFFAGVEITSNGFGAYSSDGTLMGSVVPMNKAILNMIKFTDLDLVSGIKLATINPANLLGVGNRKGTIEIGKDADIVILGDDLSVKTTIIGGKVV